MESPRVTDADISAATFHPTWCQCDACTTSIRCQYCKEWLSDNWYNWRVYDDDIVAHDTCRQKHDMEE